MLTEEKKRNRNYGSIFVYCFFCFVLVVEVSRFARPYYNNLQNLMETEAVVEEGLLEVESSGKHLCNFLRSRSVSVPARNQHKLSIPIRQETRARPPSSYCVKFQSFATMSKQVKDTGDKFESRPFSVGGYNWTLEIYPNANKPEGSGGYVSMYVRLDNSSLIASPEDVYAEITFLVYKSTTDTWHILQESEAQRFHLFKQKWGQLNFLEIGYFLNSAYGFIFDGGQSVFGVDISVYKPLQNWEVISYELNIRDPLYDWKLTKFSTLDLDSYTSDTFSSGGRNWVLKVYPNGVGAARGNSLSLFLLSTSNEGYVVAKLRVIDQNRSNHVEKKVVGWPSANGWGFDKFIALADIKRYIVDDTLIVEVEIVSFSKSDSLAI